MRTVVTAPAAVQIQTSAHSRRRQSSTASAVRPMTTGRKPAATNFVMNPSVNQPVTQKIWTRRLDG